MTIVEASKPVILCLAHLAWDFVWQRPQHLLSRLAEQHGYQVYYVNEPHVRDVPRPVMHLVDQRPGVSAYQPLFPGHDKEVLENWREVYIDQVRQLLRSEGVIDPDNRLMPGRQLVLWFYTPIPYYFVGRFPSDVVVYDIMDELANFKGAPADMKERETTLLGKADVVFTGGRSMYEARQNRHPNLHLFPSGVDADHFRLTEATPVAAALADLPRPILGYYGVIDERLDLELIDQVAAGHPEWSIVLVGPTAKIDPGSLPRRANIHYPGMQPYAELPRFLKGFDVCLMPFAINDATRYISPTKTLEYMAAHKPIVSTPVYDVVASWSDVVAIADSADGFARAVTAALNETPAEKDARCQREEVHITRAGWDDIAGRMAQLIQAARAAGRPEAAA